MTQPSLFDPAPPPVRAPDPSPFALGDPMGEDFRQQSLLRTALEMAVPLWVAKVQKLPEPWRRMRALECAEQLAAGGDQLEHRSPASGDVFNRLAEGIACLAYQPGGVELLGVRFEVPARGQPGAVVR